MLDNQNFKIEGHVKIIDDETGEILVDKDNAVNFENLSVAIAQSLIAGPLNSSNAAGFIYEMVFGNGGTSVSSTGIITYLPTNTIGQTAQLYSETYSKVINNNFSADADTVNNNLTYDHLSGKTYSDILVTCTLNYGEPTGQDAFDNSTSLEGTYVFDELGLVSTSGQLLTHVIHSPIQKSLNRTITIYYTLRISTLSSLSTT